MCNVSDVQKKEAGQLLVKMLDAAPALATELGELLGALDGGESVFVDGVRDPYLREELSAFLTALGLASPPEKGSSHQAPTKAHSQHGFRCSRGGGGVLKMVAALMDEQSLAEPPPMDRDEAFDAAKQVIDGLAEEDGIESVCDEVPVLLNQILGGEVVMLQGLQDERIRDSLTQLFIALGLESREAGEDGETGYGIPDRGGEDSEAVIAKVITSYGGERGEQDSVAGRGDEQEGQEVAGPVPRKAPIGPVMPTAAVLAQAQKATADLALQASSSDEDEDEIGPSVAGKEKRVASQIPEAGSAKRQRREELKRAAEWEKATGVLRGSQAALEKEDADNKGREEWMLVPPKSLGVLGAIKTLQPTNRKFQTRSARGARAELHAPKAPKSKAELAEEAAAEELMAKHREARGATLVERHKMDGDKAKKAAGKKDGSKTSFSWSREEDFEQRRRFTPQMYEELVQKSHDLDTKFSRSVARNFL